MMGFIRRFPAGAALLLLSRTNKSSINRCSDTVLSRMMRTTSVCCVDISPTMRSLRSSEPSRTAVSGVFSSCDVAKKTALMRLQFKRAYGVASRTARRRVSAGRGGQ